MCFNYYYKSIMRSIARLFLTIFLLAMVLPIVSIPVNAAGASFFLSPSSGSFEVGQSFTVNVSVNSGGGIGINAADGQIGFDPAALTVTKVSNTGSIFKLWTTDPTYSNTAGTASFGGGSPSSYTGSAGMIFSISFSAKKIGDTEVVFRSGNILANDGKGTNVLSGMGKANFSIIEKKVEEKKPEVVAPKPLKKEETATDKPKGLLPPIPEISSKTHPSDSTWYSNNNPEFNWKVLADLSGVSFSISDIQNDDPGKENKGIIETERFEGQKDGVQYFHIKYQNQYGWGQTSHRKLMIDATLPEAFKLTVDNQGDNTNPTPRLLFRTSDKTSGLDHFEITINEDKKIVTLDEVSAGYYQTGILAPGEHTAQVAAIDKAGNSASSSALFSIEALKAPIITSIPEMISRNEDLTIQGTSFYANVYVKVFIGQAGKATIEKEVETDQSGNWSLLYKDGLAKGSYEVWTVIVDKRGAMSLDSSRRILKVTAPSIINTYGLWIILLLLLIIVILVVYVLYQRKEFMEERERIRREAEELKVKMGKIFYALREEVDELMELADKKAGLSESERRVKEKLQESLDISEEFIGKEIEDVEKEISLPKKKQ